MQREHFELIANILNELDGHNTGLSIGTHEAICEEFAVVLAGMDERFDYDGFLAACGVWP